MPNKLMSQKDFLDKIRAEIPELTDIPDIKLMNEVFKRKPELRDKIENPMANDAAAAAAQNKAQNRSRSIVDPDVWKRNPNAGAFTKSVLDTFPALGAMGGGALATPETFGTGTIAGGALGAGAGRGLRDVATQMLGLENSSPLEKAKNIGMETGIAAITPGVTEAAMHPIDTARMGAKAYLSKLPRRVQPWVVPEALEDFAHGPIGGGAPRNPMSRTIFNNAPEVQGTVVPPGGVNDRGEAFTEGIFRHGSEGELGPATTRFHGPGSGPTEPIPNSPKGPNTDPKVIEQKGLPTGRIPKQIASSSEPLSPLKKGTNLVLDINQTDQPMIMKLKSRGFSFQGLTDDGHLKFSKDE